MNSSLKKKLFTVKELLKKGNLDEANAFIDELLEELKVAKNYFLLGEAYIIKARILNRLGKWNLSEIYARDAATFFRINKDKEKLAQSLNLYAKILWGNGKLLFALDVLKEVVKLTPQAAPPHENLALLAFLCGDIKTNNESISKLSEMVQVQQKCKSDREIELNINYYLLDGIFNLYLHKFSLSRESLRRALRVSRQVGWVREEAIALEFLGQLCYEMGRYKEALKHLDEALQIGMRVAPRGDIVNQVERRRAEVFIRLGRLEEARFAMDHAWEVTRSLGDRYEEGVLFRVEGEYGELLGEGDVEGNYRKSLDILSSMGEFWERCRVMDLLGRYLIKSGRLGEALGIYGVLEDMYGSVGYEYGLDSVRVERARVLRLMGRYREGLEVLEGLGRVGEVVDLVGDLEGELLLSLLGYGGGILDLRGFSMLDAFRVLCSEYGLRGVMRYGGGVYCDGLRRRGVANLLRRFSGGRVVGGMSFDWYGGRFYCDMGMGDYVYLEGERLREDVVLASVVRWLWGRGIRGDEMRVALPGEGGGELCLLVKDRRMREVIGILDRVKDTDYSVLLEGETGVGKELLARYIHFTGRRKKGPFVVLNCGAIPSGLLESELFGHERGVYTGADVGREGWLERADGGTIFLDEIGEMPLELQVKLLRFLEDRVVVRVGSREGRVVDVRVIAATNRDLEGMVRSGRFRSDLYYRLGVVRVRVPSLVERPGDLSVLIDYYMGLYGPGVVMGDGVREIMESYSWPGNVRELENVIRESLLRVEGGVMRIGDLPSYVREGVVEGGLWKKVIGETERRLIKGVMEEVGYVRREAARRLGISYPTLLKKLKEYGLEDLGKEKD
jgi:DNA-binding NtrC family response regulator/tetratricopeptide (TPR) repeat protein